MNEELKNCNVATEGHDLPGRKWYIMKQVGDAYLEGSTEAQAALIMATAKARGEFGKAFREATGQFENRRFKYTPMPALEDASVPALAKHGLVLLQIPAGPQNGRYLLHNWLCHEGGGILKSSLSFEVPSLAGDRDERGDANNKLPKRVGAIFTYMARYFVKTFWGLDGGEDDDVDRPEHDDPRSRDDQKAPAARQQASNGKSQQAPKTKPEQPSRVSPEEAKQGFADTRQTELPGSSAPTEEQFGTLKQKIRELSLKLVPPLETTEALKGYAEKLLKKPFEEVRGDYTALTALHHSLKLDVESIERRAAESAHGPDDPRTALMEQVHAMGAKLNLPLGTTGRVQRAELAKYVYTALGGAILDDVVRDPAQIQRLIDRMQKDLDQFTHEREAEPT